MIFVSLMSIGRVLAVHDAAGNMTKCPKPKVANEAADETSRLHLVYDAWNRLTKKERKNHETCS